MQFPLNDRALIAMIALVAGLLFGGLAYGFRVPALPSLRSAIVILIRLLEARMNRQWRSAMDRKLRGFLLTVFLGGTSFILGQWIAEADYSVPFGYLAEAALLAAFLPAGMILARLGWALKAMQSGDINEARKAVRETARRNIGQLDMHGVARAAIESTAQHIASLLVGTLLWYLILGLPGVFLYRFIYLLREVIGHRSPQLAAFGLAAEKTDDLLHIIPARLAGLLLACCAPFVPGANPARAFRVMWRDAGKLQSPNSGWPIAAVAGALDLTLAGPRSYQLAYIDDGWVGSGSVKSSVKDVKRSLYLYAVSVVLTLIALTLALIIY